MQSALPIQLGNTQAIQEFPRTFAGKAFLAIGATAFVALCAHISVPLYFTPVPLTLQTLAVILVGFTLGPALGFSAMALYLAEGAVGLPVFSPQGPGGVAQLLGPTAGFLLSYPLAAAAAGGMVRLLRLGRSRFPAAVLAGASAEIFIFALGAGWMAHLLHLGAGVAWRLGVAPFLPGEVLKIAAASGAYATFCRWRNA